MIKKYEIIMDGSKKCIKALRSFHVQGRYVNIGDVGGIVYDENTLSQEGNGWIFSGNLNYPSIHVSGDSIVDTNGYEAEVTDPRPFVNITGTSALIGAHDFVTGKAPDTKSLIPADMEVGIAAVVVGKTYEESKGANPTSLRVKATLYRGGTKTTVKVASPDYQIKVLRYDVNGLLLSASPNWVTGGPDTAVTTEDCYYYAVLVRKTAGGVIAVADITTAAVEVSEPVTEGVLSINDSRLEFQYTSAMTVATKVNPGYESSDVRKSVIDTSNVIISKAGGTAFGARIYADITQCNVAFTTVNAESTLAGTFENVKNLTYNGTFLAEYSLVLRKNLIVSGCDNFALSTATLTISGVNAANAANMPFIFTRCNMPNGRFYHNAKVKNIYTDIDFSKAQKDLGKISGNYYMSSSEVEGMYRLFTSGNVGSMLVEDYESVKNLESAVGAYNTTIYKDAYFNGKFEFAGTNVFGNKVPGHPRAVELKAKPRVVQGTLNTVVVGETVTGVAPSDTSVVTPIRYRINSGKGISVKNLPAGIRANIVVVNEHNVIWGASSVVSTDTDFTTYAAYAYAFVIFSKTGDAAIAPDELGDTTITVYNGCKIVNTGTTAVNMKGNIRVEDNATLVNADITGTGYFGGNSVVSYTPAVWVALACYGTVHMKDNAVFAPTALTGACALVHMEGNAKFIGSVTVPITNLSFIMGNNAIIEGKANTRSGVVMSGNSRVAPTGIIAAASRGALVMKDNASIEANTIVIGAITLAGNYKGDVEKTWVGKRTITDVNEPEYDNNVKSKYDL
ncbi:hypothetical protein BC679P2_00019 [Bacteroides phage BC679P2]|nr:hypothetical protein BC679P2_00019 [Bacteroides phage BC679P2]